MKLGKLLMALVRFFRQPESRTIVLLSYYSCIPNNV
jgi:hypothetical protein